MRIEMVKAALVRGHVCEAVSELVRNPMNRDVPAGGAMFLVGLFSDIEMLLGVPVEDILDDINVTQTVRDAILDREGPGGTILAAVEAYTTGDWEGADDLELFHSLCNIAASRPYVMEIKKPASASSAAASAARRQQEGG